MKLLLCIRCNEFFNLSHTYRECSGQHGGGMYVDDINARVWGPKDKVFVLGFANSSLTRALADQLRDGDLAARRLPGYGIASPGREFTAFVIPESADSVSRTETKPVDITEV